MPRGGVKSGLSWIVLAKGNGLGNEAGALDDLGIGRHRKMASRDGDFLRQARGQRAVPAEVARESLN